MQRAFAFWIIIVAGLLNARAADVPAWKLVWSDEFNGPAGSAPASTNWTYDIGGGGWGNSELESYTSRRTNSFIQNGSLVIQALQENYTGSDGIARNYTSARLKTQGKKAWAYGRFEARIKIPRGQGLWPAFWTLGSNITSVGWPACGEIDVVENIGRQPAVTYATVHGIGGSIALPAGKNLADDFHLYAVEWEMNKIRFLLDNVQYFQVTPANLPAGTTWAFDKPEFIILNVAVGGSWPGSPDVTTTFPQRMTVDYVRVYARINAPAPDLTVQKNDGSTAATWPAEFPARLQRATAIGQTWQDQLLTGSIQTGKFLEPITNGFYRLRSE